MKRFYGAVRASIVLVCVFVIGACTRSVSSIKNDQDILSNLNDGYLYIRVNTEMSLSEINISGESNIRLTRSDLRKGTNAIIVPLSAGKYQIDTIFLGRYYYELSDEKDLWSFKVEPGVISYVGDLEIERTSYNSSYFELVNNSSAALEYLEQNFPTVLGSRGIQYWGPGEDYFFDFLRQQELLIIEKLPEQVINTATH